MKEMHSTWSFLDKKYYFFFSIPVCAITASGGDKKYTSQNGVLTKAI
jgi:hypothetical protein